MTNTARLSDLIITPVFLICKKKSAIHFSASAMVDSLWEFLYNKQRDKGVVGAIERSIVNILM